MSQRILDKLRKRIQEQHEVLDKAQSIIEQIFAEEDLKRTKMKGDIPSIKEKK